MELKHLIIAAIVANAAKSGRPAATGFQPALTNAILQDARPSYGVFASLPNCWNRHQRRVEKTEKKRQARCFTCLPDSFRSPSARPVASTQRTANASEIPALDMNGASAVPAVAKNATRCGFSARQHPNYQGYVQGGDAQPSDRVAPRPATSPLTAGERIRS